VALHPRARQEQDVRAAALDGRGGCAVVVHGSWFATATWLVTR
jgi:hypothetical protein